MASSDDDAPPIRTPLDRWLWANRRSGAWLARQCDVSEPLISLVRSGKRPASESLAERLREITGLKRL